MNRTAREVVLTAGAVLGSLCLVVMLAGVAFGVRPLVFRSGSMAPTIQTGDLAMSRTVPASELHRGDIVSVLDASGTRVTHRLVNVAAEGDQRQLTLQGDANEKPDGEVYTVTEAQIVLFHVPKVGYAIGWLTGPIGIFLLGLYAALLLSVAFRRDRSDGDPPAPTRKMPPRRRAPPARRRALPAALSLAVVGVGVLWPSPSWAAPWTDAVAVSGTALSAYTVTKPAIVSCTVTGGTLSQKTARITWTEVSSPYALDYTAVIVETAQSLTVVDNGATRYTDFSTGLLSTVLNQTYNIRITASLPSPNATWKSVVSNQPVTVGTLGISLTCGTAS